MSTTNTDKRPIESITRAARLIVGHVSAQTRPSGVEPGSIVRHAYDMRRSDDADGVVYDLMHRSRGKKMSYRSGDIYMSDIGDPGSKEPVEGSLAYLMMHLSGYLKLLESNDYYDIDKFDLTIFNSADSVSFVMTLYRS